MARILIVDDEPSILELLKLTLEAAGHEVNLAGDGETALERVQRDHPELVLLDVMMPRLDGWGVLDKLNRKDAIRRPRVLVVSGKGGREEIRRSLEMGAEDVLVKPIDVKEVVRVVNEVLRKSKKELEAGRLRRLEKTSE